MYFHLLIFLWLPTSLVADSFDCQWVLNGILYDLSSYHDFAVQGPDLGTNASPTNFWKVTSLCGHSDVFSYCIGVGSTNAMVTWWDLFQGADTCFGIGAYYEDPIYVMEIDPAHIAARNGTAKTKGFRFWIPNGNLCTYDDVVTGSYINFICDEHDSNSILGRFGDNDFEGGDCIAYIDIYNKIGCSTTPAPPAPRDTIGTWKGTIKCSSNCWLKPFDFPNNGEFVMTINKCPFPTLDYNDGVFQIAGWNNYTVGFVNLNGCEAKRFSAWLYLPGEGVSGNIDFHPMDPDTLNFSNGTFVAYTDSKPYRHIEYTVVGTFVN